jgi:hypothetical protein
LNSVSGGHAGRNPNLLFIDFLAEIVVPAVKGRVSEMWLRKRKIINKMIPEKILNIKKNFLAMQNATIYHLTPFFLDVFSFETPLTILNWASARSGSRLKPRTAPARPASASRRLKPSIAQVTCDFPAR